MNDQDAYDEMVNEQVDELKERRHMTEEEAAEFSVGSGEEADECAWGLCRYGHSASVTCGEVARSVAETEKGDSDG